MDFVEKIKTIMGSSDKFYSAVKGEDLGPAVKYLIFLLLIPTTLTIIMSGTLYGFVSSMFYLMPGMMGIEAIPAFLLQLLGPVISLYIGGVYYISMFVGSFVGSAILHVVVYFMGAKRGFENTYKSVVYGGTPSTLFSWIPLVNIVFGLWSWYLVVKGLSKLQDMTMEKAFIATLVPLIVIFALGVLFWAIFAIQGAATGFTDPSLFAVD